MILASGFALLPLLTLVKDVLINRGESRLELGFDGLRQVRGTLLLVAGEGLLGAVVGTAIGWLTAVCRFPGRRWLRIAQLVPMAFPAYLLAASLIDWGSYRGLRIHGIGWAIVLLTLANYSYVFLLSTESFSVSGRRLLEASRSLGVGPWRSFFRVALPIALPSIGAGIALSAMEVVNDLGAVRLLGVPSLSAGILDRWQVDGDPQGAALLSLVALGIVAVLIASERQLRQRLASGGLARRPSPVVLCAATPYRCGHSSPLDSAGLARAAERIVRRTGPARKPQPRSGPDCHCGDLPGFAAAGHLPALEPPAAGATAQLYRRLGIRHSRQCAGPGADHAGRPPRLQPRAAVALGLRRPLHRCFKAGA